MKIENIKFKAKRIDGKGWVCGYFYEENGNTYIIENRQKESMLNRNVTYPVEPTTVCQFTGRKDSNGVDIYLGDIVEFKIPISSNAKRGIIVWADNLSALVLKYVLEDDWTYFYKGYKSQVVGNKFDKEK